MKIAWIFLVSMKNMGGAEVFILNILSKLAEFKQAKKRAKKISQIAEGIELAEMRKDFKSIYS